MKLPEPAFAQTDPSLRSSILAGATAVVIACAAGALNLPTPFGGDQAQFLVFAKELSRGAVLYRDLWDLKQPGIFWFFQAAGQLFGFDEIGIHGFELAYMAALAIVLVVALRKSHKRAWGSGLDVLLTVGVYYAVSGVHHLTQVESLVGFPLFLSVLLASQAAQSKSGRVWKLLLSGLFGGIVLVFKLILLPILAATWAASFLYALRRERKFSLFPEFAGALSIGTALPLALTILYFARRNAIPDLVYATFVMPAAAAKELPWRGIGNLVSGLLWFARNLATIVALAMVGAYARLKRQSDLLTINLCVWAVTGFGVILLQRFSWWDYHYLLLLVPLGVLAAAGIEEIISFFQQQQLKREGLVAFAAVLALLSPFPVEWGVKVFDLARARVSPGVPPILQYTPKNGYVEARTETAFLREPGSLPGNIFVFGNPTFYYISGRRPAIAMNGWSDNTMTKTQWRMMNEQLSQAQPPYIFIGSSMQPVIEQGSQELVVFIARNYDKLRQSPAGAWMVHKPAEPRSK